MDKFTTSNENSMSDKDMQFDALLGCVKLLDKAKEDANNALKADFISALEAMGNNDKLITRVKKDGLPSNIIVSSDIFSVCHQVFSKYGKVTEMPKDSEHNDKPTLLMAWLGDGVNAP